MDNNICETFFQNQSLVLCPNETKCVEQKRLQTDCCPDNEKWCATEKKCKLWGEECAGSEGYCGDNEKWCATEKKCKLWGEECAGSEGYCGDNEKWCATEKKCKLWGEECAGSEGYCGDNEKWCATEKKCKLWGEKCAGSEGYCGDNEKWCATEKKCKLWGEKCAGSEGYCGDNEKWCATEKKCKLWGEECGTKKQVAHDYMHKYMKDGDCNRLINDTSHDTAYLKKLNIRPYTCAFDGKGLAALCEVSDDTTEDWCREFTETSARQTDPVCFETYQNFQTRFC